VVIVSVEVCAALDPVNVSDAGENVPTDAPEVPVGIPLAESATVPVKLFTGFTWTAKLTDPGAGTDDNDGALAVIEKSAAGEILMVAVTQCQVPASTPPTVTLAVVLAPQMTLMPNVAASPPAFAEPGKYGISRQDVETVVNINPTLPVYPPGLATVIA
jgi:hypothetical protein